MKKCSVFLFLLVTLAAVGQKEYRIEGKVRNAAGNTVVQLLVWAGNMGKVIGSDTLKDGRFSFRGKLEEVPLRMSVLLRGIRHYMVIFHFVSPFGKSKVS